MEAKIEGYRFKLVSELVIAVFDTDDEEALPCTYIRLKEGDVKDVKDFHFEIMDWFSKKFF